MKQDNFADLPDWDHEPDDPGEEGEEWKPNPTREACKALYEKWSSITTMLNGCLKTEEEEEEEEKSETENWTSNYQAMMLGDAYQVAVKIRSSETGGIYTIRMENASIIRKNAQAIQSSMLMFMAENVIDKQYGEIIREEIEAFKQLFRTWVSTFEKDEYTDDWGLFI